jgi:hypothetical protein
VRALAYLEVRFVLHQIEAIGRSPLRLAIWIPYALSLGYLALARALGSHYTMFGSMQLDGGRLTGIGGLYLGALGVTIAMSAAGRVNGFRSAAEALLLSNSGIRPLEMAVWLQLRKLFSSALRWAGALTYYFLIFFPRHAPPLVAVVAFANALLAVALLMSVELPIFLLSRGSVNIGFRIFGWAVAAAGFAYAAVGFSGERVWAPVIAFVRCDPGGAVRSIQNGSPNPLILFCALLTVMLLAIATLAQDSLPELYAVSRRTLAETRRRQSAVRQTRYGALVSTPASNIPRGALALAWKDWIGFRRGQGSFALYLAGSLFWAVCGAGFAYASVAIGDLSPMLTLFATGGLILLFSAPHGAAAGLGGDLGKPIFWLGDDALRLRLSAWTLARALRGGFALALGPLCAGIVLHNVLLAAAALPLCLCAYWSLQALGIGLYALFPNPIDTRGPMALLRTIVTFAYVLPAVFIGALAGSFGGGVVAFITMCAILTAEGLLAIEFASYRFREAGAAMALVSVGAA